MNLKAMLNNVLSQSGFLEKGSFTSSADPDDKQMVAIANRASYEIFNYYDWGALRNTWEVNMIPGQLRYTLPADFQSLVPDSAWELDGNRQVEFPVPDRRWFMYKFTSWSDGGTLRVRMYGDSEIEVHDPDSADAFRFEYISKYPVRSAAGEGKEFFNDDQDTWVLDDQLLILAVQAHWMQTKLMPQYQEHMMNYFKKMNEAIGRSNGARTIGGCGGKGFNRGAPYYPLYRPTS
jgi:hypothetical protein